MPEHIDPIAHTLRECVVNNIDADMLIRQECPRRTQKKDGPEKIHCNSSQEFDEILRTLRMIALTALTTTAMRMAQATTRPTRMLRRSTVRLKLSNQPTSILQTWATRVTN